MLRVGFRSRGLRHHRAFIHAIGEFPKCASVFSREKRELLRRRASDLTNERQTRPAQRGSKLRPDAGKPFVFEWGKKFGLSASRDLCEGVRFFPFARDLRDQFIRGYPLGERDAERLSHRLTYCLRDVLRCLFGVSSQVGVAFIDRSHLDDRREVVGVAEHHTREMLVFLEIPGHDDEPRTQPPRLRHRHRRSDPMPPRLIRSRCHHSPSRASHRHRLAPQARIGSLFDRGKKRIGIEVEYHGVQMNTFFD